MTCLCNSTIAICYDEVETIVDLGEESLKWCFKCRKRQLHKLKNKVWKSPYYDPTTIWECPKCKDDYTQFGDG